MTQLACYGEIELRFPDATRSIGLYRTAQAPLVGWLTVRNGFK
jgi:hypothetical protein